MKVKFEGLCPHCKKQIELIRELPQDVINHVLELVESPTSPVVESTSVIAPEEVKQPARPKRNPATLKTITDMYKACFTDFKLQPKEVMAELNITAWSQLTSTPEEAYRQIAATR